MTNPTSMPTVSGAMSWLQTTSSDGEISIGGTYNSTTQICPHYDEVIETWFQFDTYQLVRVTITWIIFALSATGNLFVLFSLQTKKQLHHSTIFHLAVADLIYTFSVLPIDAIWNTTMQWFTGDAICKFAQMWKQFGMYSSSFMVINVEVDRVIAIVYQLTRYQQRKMSLILVSVAWIFSALCCIPAGVVFSIRKVPTCEGITITQCVDDRLIAVETLHSYHFFTMIASFIFPVAATIVSFSIIVCEITKMKRRDSELMGRRNSASTTSMQRAINKTVLMRTLITLTFFLCWGPYYAKGIADWFVVDHSKPESTESVSNVSYLVMYLNSLLHPIVFGIFVGDVRSKFLAYFSCGYKKSNKEISSKPLKCWDKTQELGETKNFQQNDATQQINSHARPLL